MPPSWLASETPNPVPDLANQYVGYPISIQTQLQNKLVISKFSLKDALGVATDGRLITTRTDNGNALRYYAFWIPLKPLASGTSYTAAASGTVNSTPLDITWSFSTVPAVSLTVTFSANQLASAVGSTVEATVSGGSGHMLRFHGGQSTYSFIGADPKAVFASMEQSSAATLTLKRTASACDPAILTFCSFYVYAIDSSGNTVTAKIPVK